MKLLSSLLQIFKRNSETHIHVHVTGTLNLVLDKNIILAHPNNVKANVKSDAKSDAKNTMEINLDKISIPEIEFGQEVNND